MYKLGKTSAKLGQRPSDLLGIDNRWVALQLDNAVVYVVDTIEWATSEQVNKGTKDNPDWQPKYKLSDLLRDDFRMQPPEDAVQKRPSLKEVAQNPLSGFKLWRELPT